MVKDSGYAKITKNPFPTQTRIRELLKKPLYSLGGHSIFIAFNPRSPRITVSMSGLFFRLILLVVAAAHSQSFTDVTFYAISDLHYEGDLNPNTPRAKLPDLLNRLPGTPYPGGLAGGFVDPPRAVLIAGDLINRVDSNYWKQYTTDYGVGGEKKLKFPTIEALGNHDFYTDGSIQDTFWLTQRMTERNKKRASFIKNQDKMSYNFSWDWDGVHFINLNLYGGYDEPGYEGLRSLGALEFLRNDLKENVGKSGRPVFIMQHYGLRDDTVSFPGTHRMAFASAVRGYNVIGILHGHTHTMTFYKWVTPFHDTIDVFDDGMAMKGNMLVFKITEGRLLAVARTETTWSPTLMLDKTISMFASPVDTLPRIDTLVSKDANPDSIPTGLKKGSKRHVLFSVESAYLWLPHSASSRVEIIDPRGRTVNILRSKAGRVVWNRQNSRGQRAPAGIYFLRDGVSKRFLGKIIVK